MSQSLPSNAYITGAVGNTPLVRLQKFVPEPAESPLLSLGVKGSYKVEGRSVGIEPPLLKSENYEEVRTVAEADARKMARLLAAEEGIFAGGPVG